MDIKEFFKQSEEICRKLSTEQLYQINHVIAMLEGAREHDKQVLIAGNGGSAGTASHLAADLFKMGGIRAICLNDNVPLQTAYINDDGWSNVYIEQLRRLLNESDIFIGISVHGGVGEENAGEWSQNLNAAIGYTNANGGISIGITGFDGGFMKEECHECIVVPAESTALVEAFHVVIHHLIAFSLYKGERK